MSNNTKHRCKACGKLLIDEKLFCRRCKLEGRNKATQWTGIAAGTVITLFSASAISKNSNTDTKDEDEEN